MEQNRRSRITVDAHTLIWAFDKKLHHKLSPAAKQAIQSAEHDGVVYVPIVALLEVLRQIEKGRIFLDFDYVLNGIKQSKHHEIVPFDDRLLSVVRDAPKELELFDRMIAATAIMTSSTLISKDKAIAAVCVNVIW